jgi:hypothetical protein
MRSLEMRALRGCLGIEIKLPGVQKRWTKDPADEGLETPDDEEAVRVAET